MYFSFASVTLMDWILQRDVPLRAPLTSSAFGRLTLPPGDGSPVVITDQAQPTMAALESVLRRPSYAVFASRVTGAGEAFYAAIAGGVDEAVVVVNEVPDSVSIARVERGRLVDSLAAVLPRLTPARVSPLKVSDYRVAQVNRKLNEGASDSAGGRAARGGRSKRGDHRVVDRQPACVRRRIHRRNAVCTR